MGDLPGQAYSRWPRVDALSHKIPLCRQRCFNFLDSEAETCDAPGFFLDRELDHNDSILLFGTALRVMHQTGQQR